jgi:hypothetical protein
MAKQFIFLEVLDPEINALILAITEIVSGRRLNRPAHLTVRGPYDGSISENVLAECRSAMQYDVLRIANVGRFSNPNEEVVYFQVDSPHLRSIWWKPEFTIGQYGFNPHFSLYRGEDRNWADIVAQFLEGERIELLCAEYQLVPRVTKQMQLLPPDVPISQRFSYLINAGCIHATFLARLTKLANQYRPRNEDNSEPIQALLL